MSADLPFLPFSKPTIDEATITAVGEVLRSGWITSGPKVAAFEAQLSEYFGGRPVRTFNSGTCTMEIALRIAGIGPGDEVITTPISWVATANVIIEVGATPVFADIDPVTRNIDLAKLEAAVVRAYTAMLCVAALSDRYQPAHEPRRGTIARDTRGCVWHDQAGVEEHKAAAHRTDFGTVLDQPLKDPLDVCQSCYDHVRTYAKLPTSEEIVRHHRTGKWTARTTGAFSVESIAATRPATEVA